MKKVKGLGTIAVLGCGRLGSILVRVLSEKMAGDVERVVAFDRNAEMLRVVSSLPLVVCAKSVAQAVSDADIVIIAVKPDEVPELLREVQRGRPVARLFISVAAAVRIEKLRAVLGQEVHIARVMPNIACMVGKGMTGIFAVDENDRAAVMRIFSTLGETLFVEKEEELDILTGLSASCPAFIFSVIEALSEGGVRLGLTKKQADFLTVEMVLGAAAVVKETGESPAALRDKVASPGGTTIQGLRVLSESGFHETLITALEATVKRARELSRM